MKLFFDNVNFQNNSGPNQFGLKLALELKKSGHLITKENADIQLSFIQFQKKLLNIPKILRMDGIWFNKSQNYHFQNAPIREAYNLSDARIIQSNFDKKLIENFFGKKKNNFIIHNGTDFETINEIKPIKNEKFDKYETIWATAGMFNNRPHKRLNENIKYFLEHSRPKDVLVVMGDYDKNIIKDNKILLTGILPWGTMISILKRAKYFVYLAWLDHCPNTVVDARASGCYIICSNSGGTKELIGENSSIIKEKEEFLFESVELYNPPELNFSKTEKLKNYLPIKELNIKNVCQKYLKVFEKCLE